MSRFLSGRFLLCVLTSISSLLSVNAAETDSLTLRVLSYNIRHGEGTDGKLDLERIAEEIKVWNPDLVALQEVEKGAARTQGVDQAERLGDLTDLHALFGESMPYQGGSYGNAVLSRWPILHSQIISLPNQDDREPRTALLIEIEPQEGGRLYFASTHLDFQSEELQVKQVTHLMSELPADQPILLAGDFNCTPQSPPMRIVKESFSYADTSDHRTYGDEERGRKIDYIQMDLKHSWKVNEAKVGDNAIASDHYPLFAEITLEAEKAESE